ncbi:GNAT family N-acetyltransferase [Bacillus sp. B1-b2]|uniref:GNAT family N-acetyltransferase n=1 Tax=Bacillus sp. B1-b2 TaxID=2653201 RepID=UPI00126287D5|nr:GNAT family N-acetyltransferase [Bacillus sp. B1-b2]KAB7664914.1 GNAT family N-acetyltransferase [Bacillus sp. B1-b2]
MDNKIVVEEFHKSYETEVIDLILPIQQKEYHISITKEDQPDLQQISSFYQTGKGNFWVALYNNRVVGSISLLDIGEDNVALRKMFVHRDFRGSHYKTAHLLLQQALNWAKSHSTLAIYLGTTPEFKAAHRFYEKNGFKKIERQNLPSNFPVMEVDKLFYQYEF